MFMNWASSLICVIHGQIFQGLGGHAVFYRSWKSEDGVFAVLCSLFIVHCSWLLEAEWDPLASEDEMEVGG